MFYIPLHKWISIVRDSSAPVVRQRELGQHLFGVLCGGLHGCHAGCLLAAVVLQHAVVQHL